MSIDIREAEERDLLNMSVLWSDLAEMHQEIMKEYTLADNARQEWIKFMEESMEKNNIISFVAEEKGEIIGFISVSLRRRARIFKLKNIGAIMDLTVKKERRHEGIGRSLVLRAESWIRERGFDLAVLTVAPENEGAMKFWNKMGYKTYLHKKLKKL